MIKLRTYLSSGDVKMSALGLCWYYSCCNFLTISQTAPNGEGQHYGQKASHGPIMTDYFFPLHLSLFIRFCHTDRYYLFTHSAEAMNIGSCWKRHETRLDVGSYISHFKTSVSLWAFLLGIQTLVICLVSSSTPDGPQRKALFWTDNKIP